MAEVIQIVISGFFQGTIYALLALGFCLVYRITGIITLAQGGFSVIAALAAYSLNANLGLPLWLSASLAIPLTAGVAFALGIGTFVPGLSRLSSSNMLMMTAGILSMLQGASLLIWGSQPYSLPAFSGERPLALLGVTISKQGIWVVGIAALIFVSMWFLLMRTYLGQALRACAENAKAARLMGIGLARMRLLGFVLAATIAAAAGVVIAPATSFQFDSGNALTILGFISVAIGGLGSFPGSIAGGLLLGIGTQLATAYISSLFSTALALTVLLAILLWRPSGLFSVGAARREDVREEARVWRHTPVLDKVRSRQLALAVLLIVGVLPWVTGNGGLLTSLVITGILFIAVMGLDVFMGYMGQVNLGQAGFMAIGGYTAGYLTTVWDAAPLLALLAGLVLALLAAFVLALVTMRLRGLYLALATLSFGLLIDALAVGLDGITGGPSGMVGIPSFSLGRFSFDSATSMYYLVLAIIVALVFFLSGALRSRWGRALQAIRTDQLAAAALGIDVPRYKLGALLLSAGLASLAGSLYAFFFHFLSPDMVATNTSIELVTMMVMGGEGTLVGPVLGTIVLTLLPTVFQPLAAYKTFASGALLVLFFLFLPGGLYGALVRLLPNKPARGVGDAAVYLGGGSQ